jgi:5-methylcytosine-specific restriction endonuclease McrA
VSEPGSRITGKRGDIKTRCETYGVPYDPAVTRYKVFERDGFTCRLCGERTEPKMLPHPRAATVDHVVPLSRGGGHTWGNVQCAHYECNMRKGRKIG